MMGIYALEPFLGTHYFKILTWPLIMTVFLNQLSTVLLYHFNRLTHVCIKIRLLQQMFIWLKLKRHERASPIFDYILGIFLAFLVKTCTYVCKLHNKVYQIWILSEPLSSKSTEWNWYLGISGNSLPHWKKFPISGKFLNKLIDIVLPQK